MLIRQTIAYLPAQLLGPLAQFAAAIILTHFFSPADYGLTMLIFASQELIFQVVLAWWSSFYLRYAGNYASSAEKVDLHRTESSILILTTALQILVTVGLVLLVSPGFSWLLLCGACLFVVSRSYLAYVSEKARSLGNILAYSALQIIAPVGGLALTVALMQILPADPARVLLDFAITHLLTGLLVAWKLDMLAKPGPFDRRILRAALSFGVPLVISNAFGWIAAHGIRFVVQYGASPTALGLLSVGWGLAIRITAVAAMGVAAAAYPLAVRAIQNGDPEGARNQIATNSVLLFGLIAPSTAGIMIIADPFVTLMVADEYRAATIAILPWALACSAIRNLRMHGFDQIYLLFEAPRAMIVLEGTEAALTVLGAFVGLMAGGLVGSVIGVTFAAAVIAIGDFAYLNRRFKLALNLSQFARVGAATALMCVVLLKLPDVGIPITGHWSSILLAVGIGMVVYGLLIAILFYREVRAGLHTLRA
ncbi:RfbX Membrane protein involved in the export of O-antigen and teichoic acid [Rhabdaerophilaceae bacterium]